MSCLETIEQLISAFAVEVGLENSRDRAVQEREDQRVRDLGGPKYGYEPGCTHDPNGVPYKISRFYDE